MTRPVWQKKLPMIATYSRIALTPVIFGLAYHDAPWALPLTALIFIIGSITDYFDGYLARKYNTVSNEGRLMDPIADKIMVLAALIILLDMDRVGPVIVTLFLARDILIGGIRSIAAAENIIISAEKTGKWKAALQMISIPCLFIYDNSFLQLPFELPLKDIGYYGLLVSVVLSSLSGYNYVMGYLRGKKQA